MTRELAVELRLVNEAIRSMMRLDPPLSRRRSIVETVDALGRHRRYLLGQRRPVPARFRPALPIN